MSDFLRRALGLLILFFLLFCCFQVIFLLVNDIKEERESKFPEIKTKSDGLITNNDAVKYKLTCLNGLVVNEDGLNLLNGNGKPLEC